jgi:hypothetical protein
MNSGERDEFLAVIRLTQMRDAGKSLPLLEQITSVGFKGLEYKSSQWCYGSGEPTLSITDSALTSEADSMGFKKAGKFDKADVYVNGFGVSLKSMRNAAPALINHTTRPGWARICKKLNLDIAQLDSIIEGYWKLRQSGVIKEDTFNGDSHSPFRNHKEYLQPLLEYFLFLGTSSKDSNSPASYLLDFNSPIKESTWEIFTPEGVIDLIWAKLVFCVRSKKGMPTGYPSERNRADHESVKLWTKFHQEQYRGALHMRKLK